MTQYTKRISKKKKPEFCFLCNDSDKFCKGKHTRDEKKLSKFVNWVNYNGNSKTGIQLIDNHYTEYGKGYRDAMFDVYVQLTKTFKLKGFDTK